MTNQSPGLPEPVTLSSPVQASFEVGSVIGRGAVGIVYAGRQLAPQREVAIKVLREELAADESARRRFIDEANICARISDSVADASIVRVISVVENLFPPVEGLNGELLSRPAIVMELLCGVTLKDRLSEMRKKGQTLGVDEATRIIKAVLSALEVMHSHPVDQVVHRDIKPANIFLCQKETENRPGAPERVVVTDFGIARVVSAASLTKTNGVVGTPEYMSPEQVEGKNIDGRADLYSCGILLYEMLTGSVPFALDNPMAVAYAHLNKTPPPLPTTLSAPLREATRKALAKNPAQRFQTASEFSAALETHKKFTVGKPLIITGVCLLFGVPLLFAAQPTAHKMTRIETETLPPLPAAPTGVSQRVLAPGRPGQREITETVVYRFGREQSRSVSQSRTLATPAPPRLEQTSFQSVETAQPAPQTRLTMNLRPGERRQVESGHKGHQKWKLVRVLEGPKLLTTTRTLVERQAGTPEVFEEGRARPKPQVVQRVIRDTPRPAAPVRVRRVERAKPTRKHVVREAPSIF